MKTKGIGYRLEGSTARKIVRKIIADLTDRRGLRQEWEQIDKETQKEIIQKWVDIIMGVLG